jgi:hypothetical protein
MRYRFQVRYHYRYRYRFQIQDPHSNFLRNHSRDERRVDQRSMPHPQILLRSQRVALRSAYSI